MRPQNDIYQPVCFGPAMDKQQPTNDYIVEFMEMLGDIHQYACQHLKVSSYRLKALYDRIANSTRFLEGDIWLFCQLGQGESCFSCRHPGKALTRITDVIRRIQ
jgi:hypothetical protein